MISIHLRRAGAKRDPHYRVVVADNRAARDGAFIEILGHYHPRYQPAKLVLDVERIKDWIARGAQPSDTVKSLLRQVESGKTDIVLDGPDWTADAAETAEDKPAEAGEEVTAPEG